jgi:hypothetical protein
MLSTSTSRTNRTSSESTSPAPTPRFGTIDCWCAISGMGRRATYDALGRGDLRAVKVGTRTLINIEKGLAWLESRPAAQIKAPKQRNAA